ncbi:hypothetical protein JCM8097_004105 [Rhodosporidiobolus ruineniae]
MSTRCTLPREPAPAPLLPFLRSLVPPIAPKYRPGHAHPSYSTEDGCAEVLNRQHYGPMPSLVCFDPTLVPVLERQMLDVAAEALLGGTGDGHVSTAVQSTVETSFSRVGEPIYPYSGHACYAEARFMPFFVALNNVRASLCDSVGESLSAMKAERVTLVSNEVPPVPAEQPGQPKVKIFETSQLILSRVPAGQEAKADSAFAEIAFFAVGASGEKGEFRQLEQLSKAHKPFKLEDMEDDKLRLTITKLVGRAATWKARMIVLLNHHEFCVGYLLPTSSALSDADSGYISSSSSATGSVEPGYRLVFSSFHPVARAEFISRPYTYRPPGAPDADVAPSPPPHDPVPPSLLNVLLLLSIDKVDERALEERVDEITVANLLLPSVGEAIARTEEMQIDGEREEMALKGEEDGLPTLEDVLDADVLLLRYPSGQVVRTVRVRTAPPTALRLALLSATLSNGKANLSRSPSQPAATPKTVHVAVAGPLGKGHSAVAFLVWLRGTAIDGKTAERTPFVLKVASERAGPDGRVRREGERLLALSEREKVDKCIVPALAVFDEEEDDKEKEEKRGSERPEKKHKPWFEAPETRAVFLMPYGGEAANAWGDFTRKERIELFLRLLELHQAHQVSHGSVYPRNAVRFLVGSSSFSSPSRSTSTLTLGSKPRWIDLGRAKTDHKCSEACYELKDAFWDMDLGDAREEVVTKAEERGLKWA